MGTFPALEEKRHISHSGAFSIKKNPFVDPLANSAQTCIQTSTTLRLCTNILLYFRLEKTYKSVNCTKNVYSSGP